MGKNYLILDRLVGETFKNQWKNIYPCSADSSRSLNRNAKTWTSNSLKTEIGKVRPFDSGHVTK